MSDSGETASGGLLSEGLPGVASDEFDPLVLYDQIYPDWRNGPALSVDPLTEPMPTDPSLGSMDAEATTFPGACGHLGHERNHAVLGRFRFRYAQ